jgi:hypothetical protein
MGVHNLDGERWVDGSHTGDPLHHRRVDKLLLYRIIRNEGRGVKDKAFLGGRLSRPAAEREHSFPPNDGILNQCLTKKNENV